MRNPFVRVKNVSGDRRRIYERGMIAPVFLEPGEEMDIDVGIYRRIMAKSPWLHNLDAKAVTDAVRAAQAKPGKAARAVPAAPVETEPVEPGEGAAAEPAVVTAASEPLVEAKDEPRRHGSRRAVDKTERTQGR